MNPRAAFIVVALVVFGAARTASAGWVIAGFFGSAGTSNTSLTLTQAASATSVRFDGIDYEGRSFSLPPYYGYRGAYFFRSPGWFGIEGEVIHMKVYARPGQVVTATGVIRNAAVAGQLPLDTIVQRFSLSHGQNMLLVNAVLRHAFGECGDYRTARVQAVGRVGVGPTLPHVESTILGVADEHYESGSAAFQAAGGLELRVWKGLHAVAEYKFTRCRQSVNAANEARVETLLSTHHFAFGASWHF